MTGLARVVVAGAGLAGLRVAEELRAQGYGGALTLIGAEDRPPYDRPPLSKKVLAGDLDDTSLRPDLDELGIELRLAESAVGLGDGVLPHRGGRVSVRRAGGHRREPGRAAGRRTSARAAHRRGRPRAARTTQAWNPPRDRRGWLDRCRGCYAAARRGCTVTVLEAAAAPLAAAIGPQIGLATVPWYGEAGVHLRLGQCVDAIEPGGVTLSGGGWLAADVVLTAVGVRPAVAWLAGSAVAVDNGVAADARLRTTAPGVYAVGDCASFWSRRYQQRLRFEHWDIALHGPAAAAANILGGARTTTPFLTSGRSSSAGWCSTRAGTAAPSGCSGAVIRPGRPGRPAG